MLSGYSLFLKNITTFTNSMPRKKTGSPKLRLNKEDAKQIGKVFIYVAATAAVTALIDLVSVIEFAPELYWVPGTLNMLLVAAKKFLTDGR